MPESLYIPAALAVAVVITVALRTIPFLARRRLRDSALLFDLGRWMPLGIVTILAIYCLSLIDLSAPTRSAGPLVGVAVTVAIHLWRRNMVLSITAGTLACVLVANAL